ncbi:MAG: hypothetical protein QJR06_00345 [Alicyclobacillaceae bacterium]|nr:hypothetical protein [Alicyclobacillaceae bacterium]
MERMNDGERKGGPYRPASLPPHLVKELQTFEARLSAELGREVILLCYDGAE